MEQKKNLIIFTDSGDTIVDEAAQRFAAGDVVTDADLIEDAGEVLRQLQEEGYRIALVADGLEASFQNVYEKKGLRGCFQGWTVSETVGVEKPDAAMFQDAMTQLGLAEEDKKRIVMIGNNLAKDVAGANRFGITSIWLDWSPRYFHEYREPDWKPDYIVHHPSELPALLERLDRQLGEEGHSQNRSWSALSGLLRRSSTRTTIFLWKICVRKSIFRRKNCRSMPTGNGRREWGCTACGSCLKPRKRRSIWSCSSVIMRIR